MSDYGAANPAGPVLLWSVCHGRLQAEDYETVEDAADDAMRQTDYEFAAPVGAEDFTSGERRWLSWDSRDGALWRLAMRRERERAANPAPPRPAPTFSVVVLPPVEVSKWDSANPDAWDSFVTRGEADHEAERLRAVYGDDRVEVRPL